MKRVITGVLLALAASYVIFFAPLVVFKFVALYLAVTCYWEYTGLVAAHGIPRPSVFGALAGVLFLFTPGYVPLGLSLLAILALIAALRHGNLHDVLPQVSAEFLGAIYAFLPWRFAELLRIKSVHWVFFAVALNWAGDSAAYYAGRAFGRHRMAPVVSPKKSWEGAAGSIVGSLIFGLIYMGYFQPDIAWWKIASIAVVANIAGQFGDLAESAIKRGAGLKDSGKMLPGHGGMLDRVDSSLFALPVVYALVLLIG